MVNKKEMVHMDCNNEVLPFGPLLVDDVLSRTETAMSQTHCFLATELALKAQKNAKKIMLKNAVTKSACLAYTATNSPPPLFIASVMP